MAEKHHDYDDHSVEHPEGVGDRETSPHHERVVSRFSPRQRRRDPRFDVAAIPPDGLHLLIESARDRAFIETQPARTSAFISTGPVRWTSLTQKYRPGSPGGIGFGRPGTGNPMGRPSKQSERDTEANILLRAREREWKNLTRPESINTFDWGLLKQKVVYGLSAPAIARQLGQHGMAAAEAMKKRLQRAKQAAEAAIPGFDQL